MFDGNEWRLRRNNIFHACIDEYGFEFFENKNVLELGCGYGHLGEMFRLFFGARLTCLEARKEHCEEGEKIHPNLKFVCADLDAEWIYPTNDFDVILHIGTLYHLEKPENNLIDVCNSMKPNSVLILETEFVDTDDMDAMLCLRRQGYNLSFREFGCRPSHGMIETTLRNCKINFKKVTATTYDSPLYMYSIPLKNDYHFNRAERGLWFGKKEH